MICPGDPQRRNANTPNFEDRSQEETEWQERCARETAWRLARNILKSKEKHQTAFFSLSENWCLPAPSAIKTRGKRICCGLQSVDAHDQQKGFEFRSIGNRDDDKSLTTVITANGEVQTNEEATVYVKELGIFLTMEVFEDKPAVLPLGKLCDEHGYSYEWITGRKTHLIKNGIRTQCNMENFVPIVVPGLSASSSSSLPTLPPMTPTRQEIDHSKSSSSSSTSTPMTSSTEIDHSNHPPAIVSSESVDRQVRGDPYSSETSEEMLNKPTKTPNQIKMRNTNRYGETRIIQTYRNGCKNSERILWMTEFLNAETHTRVLLMNHLYSLREVCISVNTVFILTSRNTEIARSARGPKSQGPRAEDVLAQSYLVQKILVI